jgi:hypothetical protein
VTNARTVTLHRNLDRQHTEARDGHHADGPDINRPRRWRTDTSGQQSKVLLVELRERTSAKGLRYLAGWMGKARLVAFAGEADETGHRMWSVYASEPDTGPAKEGRDGG